VPFGTLQSYRSGGEMKLSNAVAIARATGVRLAWLATGQGPMRPAEQLAAPAPPPDAPFRLFGKVRIDRLVQAYEGALASTGGADRRLTMHLTVVLYDQLSDAAEAQENPATAPVSAPEGPSGPGR
jgi:phage repressor protein C with HTH and peptisase S24 domain